MGFLSVNRLRPPPTSDEILLCCSVDAGQMTAVLPAVLLGILPGVSAAEIPVAVAVKLSPRVLAALDVCEKEGRQEGLTKKGTLLILKFMHAFFSFTKIGKHPHCNKTERRRV